tara:strand:- start:902 stop:2293 length:1392 start_codon:yes stop_codon:yes gene_type:complete
MNKYFEIINPYDGQVVGESPNLSQRDIGELLNKTFNYQDELKASDKYDIISLTIKSFKKYEKSLSELISMETGLSINGSKHEVHRASNCLSFCLKQIKSIYKSDLTDEYSKNLNKSTPKLSVLSEPLDLAIGITPFNHPLNMVIHKVGPAIVAGTPIIIKPSEKTPLTAYRLRKILINNGLPEDFFNIISGLPPKDVVDQIISYPKYDLVCFTGGVSVGKYIARKMVNSGNELKKYIPELGGNAVFVVMDDCNVELAAELALGAFENSGQRCTAIRRILLHKNISKNFIDRFVELTSQLKYGDPFDSNNHMGTVISPEQAQLINQRVDDAIKEGARLLIGNKIDGALYAPTILDNVSPNSEIVQKETFGPVVSIMLINDLTEAISYLKSDRFGLASGIVTESKKNALKLYDNICVGQFNWNGRPGYRTEEAPFGGFKDSGNGEKEGIVLMTKAFRRIRTFYEH